MAQSLSTSSMALKNALYFGSDEDLKEAVRVSIMSKYTTEGMESIPHIWPADVSLVLLEYQNDTESVLAQISQILTLAKGVPIYVLLKEKDADFIIEASHQGAQGFIECPNEVFHILSILHMQDRRRQGKNGNVSSIFSLKGGVGCTALATNIASHLTDMTEGRTVLVDLNMPLGDTALYLNMEGQRLYTLTDFVYNLNRFDENLIYKSLSRHESGLYVLSLPVEVSELEGINGDIIKTIIESLRRYYDHVLIDCASDLSDMTLSCLDESDNIVLVTEPSLSSLRAVNSVLQLTQKLGYIRESIKLVVNRSTSHEDEMLDDVIDALDVDTIVRVANEYASFNDSLREGIPLKTFKPECVVNRQLHNIANMLHTGSLQVELDEELKTVARKGFFSGFFKKNASSKQPQKREPMIDAKVAVS